jgi:hypothetical protein
VPTFRCTQVIEARFASTGKVCAHNRYRRIRSGHLMPDHLLLVRFVPPINPSDKTPGELTRTK